MIKQSESGRIICELKEKYTKLWENTPDTFPVLRVRYDHDRRKQKDAAMSSFADDIIRLVKSFSDKNQEDSVRWGSELKRLLYSCGTDILGLERSSVKMLLEDGFCDSTSDFVSKAREFDAGFKLEDIFQSLRNVWIMNCIQKLIGMKVEMTPSVFAYSMLYPYTDNYLDASSISEKEKEQVNFNLRKRLAGEYSRATSELEEGLFRLVQMIERQFPRNSFPMVYGSLLGIQSAQERSLLQASCNDMSFSEILDISVEKGGCSVLADGFLVKGLLSAQEASFVFGFGVMLQFIDDLQDAVEDRKNGHITVFSRLSEDIPTERIVNRLVNFMTGVLDGDRCFCSAQALKLKELIRDSILFLVMGAIACNSRVFDRDWLRMLEEYSPLSFKFLKSFYERMEREFNKLKIKFALKPMEVPMARAFSRGILS